MKNTFDKFYIFDSYEQLGITKRTTIEMLHMIGYTFNPNRKIVTPLQHRVLHFMLNEELYNDVEIPVHVFARSLGVNNVYVQRKCKEHGIEIALDSDVSPQMRTTIENIFNIN